MQNLTFDTLSILEKLKNNNAFNDLQVKNLINVFRKIETNNLNIVAIKKDLQEYYYKTIIALGTIVTTATGIIVAILHH